MTRHALDVRNLHITIPTDRGALMAVRGVDLAIAPGETLCLVGESGCGKSLTALGIMGLLPRYACQSVDRFVLAGEDISTNPRETIARLRGRKVAMIFQDPTASLNPTLSIGRQLTEGVMRSEGTTRSDANVRAMALLDRVGISNPKARLRQYPHELSGGQRQRIMIASALMGSPQLLIADEPTTALDVTIQAQILALLGELQKDLGLSLLLITHDLGVVATIATTVSVMYAGRIAEHGSTNDVFATPMHPYTRGLLRAIPVPRQTPRGQPLPAIPGRVPGLIGGMEGCAFRDRCEHVREVCAHSPIPLRRRRAQHFAECTLDVQEVDRRQVATAPR